MHVDMTYRLSGMPTVDLTPLLAPEKLISAADILAKREVVPAVAGLYGWWFDAPLPGVSTEGTLQLSAYRLLYIGIAPRRPSAAGVGSKSNIRKRILRNHLGSRIGSSTLRRSLAHLLSGELGLHVRTDVDRQRMTQEHEASLSRWIGRHAAISFLAHHAAWNIENVLISQSTCALPLNIAGSTSPSARNLAAIRRC